MYSYMCISVFGVYIGVVYLQSCFTLMRVYNISSSTSCYILFHFYLFYALIVFRVDKEIAADTTESKATANGDPPSGSLGAQLGSSAYVFIYLAVSSTVVS